MEERHHTQGRSIARFIAFTAAVFTGLMLLFPPYTGLAGIEYAFVATGPEWAGQAGALGNSLGLSAAIHWPLLVAQVAVLWLLVYGAWRYLLAPAGAGVG